MEGCTFVMLMIYHLHSHPYGMVFLEHLMVIIEIMGAR
jgi:hypothetical protein